MSQDFTFVFAGPRKRLFDVVVDISKGVGSLGLRTDDNVDRMEYGDSPNVDPSDIVSMKALNAERMEDWRGAAMSCWGGGFTLDLDLVPWDMYDRTGSRSSLLNCFSGTNVRSLERIARQGVIKTYYAALTEVARACGAVSGYGEFQIEFDPICPADVIMTIRNGGTESAHPVFLGVVSQQEMSLAEVQSLAGDIFEIRDLSGFWFLEGRAFVDYIELNM